MWSFWQRQKAYCLCCSFHYCVLYSRAQEKDFTKKYNITTLNITFIRKIGEGEQKRSARYYYWGLTLLFGENVIARV
jgi:hypothetical protein